MEDRVVISPLVEEVVDRLGLRLLQHQCEQDARVQHGSALGDALIELVPPFSDQSDDIDLPSPASAERGGSQQQASPGWDGGPALRRLPSLGSQRGALSLLLTPPRCALQPLLLRAHGFKRTSLP